MRGLISIEIETRADYFPVVAEPVVLNLLNEAIEQLIKLKEKAKSLLHFKEDIERLSDYLKKLRIMLGNSMSDYKRFEVSPYAQNPELKKMVEALYKIARDAEDVIQDCQYERNRGHRLLLPFTMIKRVKEIQRRIETMEVQSLRNCMEVMEGRVAADPPTADAAARALSISISAHFESSTTGEFRRTTLRLASMRRNSIKRRSQPIDVVPVGLDHQISYIQRLLLEDEEPYMLGIHGMGGAGKSLLMKSVWNSDEIRQSFENDCLMIWVTVSSGQLAWLQSTIAEQIHMPFDKTWTEDKGKAEIFRRLERERFLMVLDGVWPNESAHFLSDLGVPPISKNGSKIAVISRDILDLRKIKVDMHLIHIQRLSQKDGWKLFKRYAFGSDTSTLPLEVLQAAKKIANRCNGHPLALKAYGAAMAGQRDLCQWQLALGGPTEQADNNFFSNHTDAERRILQCLRSSYESLSPILRIAFLYFAAFPENHVVRTTDLIDLWTAERLIRAENPSELDAHGRRLLNIMIERCVVEGVEVGSLGRVRKCKMHPMFRHLATHILQKEDDEEERSLFRAGDNLAEFPSKEISQRKHQRISLMYNRITCLPEEFKCLELRTLILRHSERLSAIPPGFLQRLTKLKTLDLSMTGIESLPGTVGRLKRLEYLNVSRTKLKCLPLAVTRLHRLESLNLFECKELECLPVDLNKLKQLLYLNLRRCAKLRFIPIQVTQITSLQCLIMDGCNDLGWKHQTSPPENNLSRLEDLKSLIHLRYLSFVYTEAGIPYGLLRNFDSMERLELCRVPSQSLPEDIQEMKTLQDLRLSRLERLVEMPAWLSKLSSLRRITLEYLNVKALPPRIFETLPLLRLLEIENCYQLTDLPAEFGKEGAFPALEELRLDNLKALKELPGLEEGSMRMLRELRVRFCERINNFPKGVEKLNKNTRIDIVGSCELIRSVEGNGSERQRLKDFLGNLNC